MWALHSDNGVESLNDHLVRYIRKHGLTFHRGRPYRKNDQPYVEQKNRQFGGELVGYGRYDTSEDAAWLNEVYTIFDPYANLFLLARKLIEKIREGGRVCKRYDEAMAPVERLIPAGAITEKQLASARWVRSYMSEP